MSTHTFVDTFVTVHCYKCGVAFGMTESMQKRRRDDGESFWCPNGHSQCYCESNVKKLEKQLAREKSRHDQTEASLHQVRRARERTERRLSATKGVVTRIKNRVKNGVCPCCNRHFKDLHRHMKNQHPEYGESE